MTLPEKIYALDSLMAEAQEKRKRIDAAIRQAGKIKDAVEFLEDKAECDEIAINVSEYGYSAVSGGWEAYKLYVNRDDFYQFLEEQREKHLSAADKLAEELLERTRERKQG